MAESLNVLVIGAGVAGLSAARALGLRDISVDVVERTAEAASGTGLFLPGNAVRALSELGLRDEVVRQGVPIRYQELRNRRGRMLAEIEMSALWRNVAECVGIAHGDLRTALKEKCLVPVRASTTVQSMTEHGSGVDVTFSDGRSGRYDVVVGADGIRSQTRRTVDSGAPPLRYAGQVCWRFLTENYHGIDRWTGWMGKGATFLAVPVNDRQLYCYADLLMPSLSLTDRRTATSGLQRFLDFDPVVGQLLSAPEAQSAYFSRVEEVHTTRWTTARTVLIGDAAHATSPNMAQGVAMAVEDALVLADCLDRRGTTTELLAAFERRRQPRIRWVHTRARKRDRMRGTLPVLRDLALRIAAKKMYESSYAPLRDAP